MISYANRPFTEEESLGILNKRIRGWFESKYKTLTPPQRYSFKLIDEGKNMLITAPTGSGKTFSAFISILSKLFDMADAGQLEDKVYCIYISPLRALNNDIYRNLMLPLDGIYGEASGEKRITVGIRTGDTTQQERQRQLARPPNILITTPESLAILMNSSRFVENLKEIKYVVIDELHELANNKRGVHLSLSLERLAEFVGHDFVRIGLGATLNPLEEAAKFLVGYKNEKELRDCIIVDATWNKKLEFITMSPVADIVNAKDKTIEDAIYRTINSIVKQNSTTLVFTNTRSGTERVVFNLTRRFKYGEGSIAAHHGSLSREVRLGVEEMLKKGKLKCVVSSTSLELGVDIGFIDNVIQVGSPKSITRAVQRIGRSGHNFNDVAVGEIIVMNRDDLVECAVMLNEAKERQLDSFTLPKNALDVLAQHIVGMALNKKWHVTDAITTIRKAHPYHELQEKDFRMLLEYLSGMYVGLESRRVYAKIWYDEKEGVFGRRGRLTKLIYYLNIGTIPDEVAVNVYTTDKKWIGSIEEEFLSRLRQGDIFTLGGKLYRFEYAREMKCYVSRAETMVPTIPPWFSEQLPLTYELAIDIGRFRKELGKYIKEDIVPGRRMLDAMRKNSFKPGEKAKHLLDSMPIDAKAKNAIYGYFLEQIMFANFVPNDRLVVIEATRGDGGRNLLVFHSLYGRRVNDALSRMFGILVSELYQADVGVTISDNGFVIITDKTMKFSRSNVEELLKAAMDSDIAQLLKDNIRRTEMMKRRFRHCAARSLMVLRNYRGVRISVKRQQINSQQLLDAVEEISGDFPILKETYREILEDVMDLPRAKQILSKMKSGEIEHRFVETELPSPFSHLMITFGEADVVMMKDRRRHLRELHKHVLDAIKERMQR